MRIAHVCLSNFFVNERAYQENELVDEHAKQGHEVLVIASTDVRDEDGKKITAENGWSSTSSGVDVVRLKYKTFIPHFLALRVRAHSGLYKKLSDFCPDVILFHGMCAWDLLVVKKYKRKNPGVVFYVDTHTDFINSARGFFSKWILHFIFYKNIVRYCLGDIDKIFYISKLTGDFASEFYGIPKGKLEFYPLGGHPVPADKYAIRRKKARDFLGFDDSETVFIQSGKQSADKKIIESLTAFSNNSNPCFKFIIVGALLGDIRERAESLIASDERIKFLGWKTTEELRDLLCASDVYLQPGSQSATLQASLCCYCVPVISNIPGHEMYAGNNGWLINDVHDIEDALKEIETDVLGFNEKKLNSISLAINVLDYSALAKRIID